MAGVGILALDFFTVGLLNGSKVYVLAVIEHGIRRIQVPGPPEKVCSTQVRPRTPFEEMP